MLAAQEATPEQFRFSHDPNEEERSPEYELYREAMVYDRKLKAKTGLAPSVSGSEPTTRRSTRRSRQSNAKPETEPDIPDNVSDSGTYTIAVEMEKPQVDMTQARQSIDHVFGVRLTKTNDQELSCPVIHQRELEVEEESYSAHTDDSQKTDVEEELEEDVENFRTSLSVCEESLAVIGHRDDKVRIFIS